MLNRNYHIHWFFFILNFVEHLVSDYGGVFSYGEQGEVNFAQGEGSKELPTTTTTTIFPPCNFYKRRK